MKSEIKTRSYMDTRVDNLEETDRFLKGNKLPRLNKEALETKRDKSLVRTLKQ